MGVRERRMGCRSDKDMSTAVAGMDKNLSGGEPGGVIGSCADIENVNH